MVGITIRYCKLFSNFRTNALKLLLNIVRGNNMAKYLYNFFSPLINFSSSDSEIIISDDLIIRQTPDSDLKILDDLKRK